MHQYTVKELQAMRRDDLIRHIIRLYMEYYNLEDDYNELERKWDDLNEEYMELNNMVD